MCCSSPGNRLNNEKYIVEKYMRIALPHFMTNLENFGVLIDVVVGEKGLENSTHTLFFGEKLLLLLLQKQIREYISC